MTRMAGRAGSGCADMGVTMDPRGPLFDGRAEKLVADAANDAEKAVATLGASMIRSRMAQVFKDETPFYRFANVAKKEFPGWIIWDQDKTKYGFWLEGIGSRNFPKTRFRGYFTYWRIYKELALGKAQTIADGVVRKYVERMR
jgi:hypothetical protein